MEALDVDCMRCGPVERLDGPLAKRLEPARQGGKDGFGVARVDDVAEGVVAHEVRERTVWRQRDARPAQVHDLEDLGGIDSAGAGQVIEQAQHGVTSGELGEGLLVLQVSEAHDSNAFRSFEVRSLGLDDASDETYFQQLAKLGFASVKQANGVE